MKNKLVYDGEQLDGQHRNVVLSIEHHSDDPVLEALREQRQVLRERRVAVQTDQRLQALHTHFSHL